MPKTRRLMCCRTQNGGVLIEFVISLPLLFIFLLGILSSGRVLNQIATAGQAAFLGGLYASQIDSLGQLSNVPERVNKILCLQSRRIENINCAQGGAVPNSLVTVTHNPNAPGQESRVVTIDVHGELRLIYKPVDIDLKVTAPLLLIDRTISLGNLAQPGNPQVLYGCAGGTNSAMCDCCSGSVRGDYCGAC